MSVILRKILIMLLVSCKPTTGFAREDTKVNEVYLPGLR